jgi:hypothetical protein
MQIGFAGLGTTVADATEARCDAHSVASVGSHLVRTGGG